MELVMILFVMLGDEGNHIFVLMGVVVDDDHDDGVYFKKRS